LSHCQAEASFDNNEVNQLKMLWKFVIGTLVLPCCLGLETASAAIRKDIQSTQSELELLSTQSEQIDVGEAIPAIYRNDYKISHHRRRDRKSNYYKRRHYQRRNYHPNYRRVNHRDNYQDCPEYQRRRSNYRPTYHRQEAYPMHDMIYRRHYHRRH
jgi:hypothetical protein